MVIEVYGGPSFVVEDIASFLGRQFGHRIVMWLHGGAFPEFMARHPRWSRRVLGRADRIIAPTKYLARAVSHYGFDAGVVPNVIDIDSYPYRHRPSVAPRLFWMRNFHSVWNPEMAIRTLHRLCATVPEATLVMAGPDKGSRAAVERLASELNVSDKVRFTGFLDGPGKVAEASAADIFINTNRIDNMPVAVVEAMACGLPVVTTAVGGMADLLTHGETGLFVPNNDEEAMARAIACLMRNSELASRLSANGRMLAENSSWDRVRPQWEQVFGEAFSGTVSSRVNTVRANPDRELTPSMARIERTGWETH
jgi:glycosyltransferase involved in cell wall biosynthesis